MSCVLVQFNQNPVGHQPLGCMMTQLTDRTAAGAEKPTLLLFAIARS